MNNGNGALLRLITDENSQIVWQNTNESSNWSKGLSENMEAEKHNFIERFLIKKRKRRDLKS
jgi:phospholipid/cholesterol/gamma-HCH transport system substrate-binding protein